MSLENPLPEVEGVQVTELPQFWAAVQAYRAGKPTDPSCLLLLPRPFFTQWAFYRAVGIEVRSEDLHPLEFVTRAGHPLPAPIWHGPSEPPPHGGYSMGYPVGQQPRP